MDEWESPLLQASSSFPELNTHNSTGCQKDPSRMDKGGRRTHPGFFPRHLLPRRLVCIAACQSRVRVGDAVALVVRAVIVYAARRTRGGGVGCPCPLGGGRHVRRCRHGGSGALGRRRGPGNTCAGSTGGRRGECERHGRCRRRWFCEVYEKGPEMICVGRLNGLFPEWNGRVKRYGQ